MKRTVRTALLAGFLGAGMWGLAGAPMALAVPVSDPNGLCNIHDSKGNCWVAASGPSVDINMVFPANDPQEQAIVDYLTKVEKDFQGSTELGTLDDPKPAQALDVTSTGYTSGTPATGTRTAVLKVYQNLGGAHPATWYKAYAYSNAAEAPITFGTLFRPGSQPLGTILPIVEQQLSATAGQPITVSQDVGLDPANYQNFAITNDAVIFFFDQNQIHPALEATEVSVPRTAIADLLSPGI
jgi:hypothetical protein